jgi:hypothetical protein
VAPKLEHRANEMVAELRLRIISMRPVASLLTSTSG